MTVQTDVNTTPVGSDALGVIAADRSRRDLVRCGAELVGVSERFYGGLFLGGVVFVGLAALAAIGLWPLRDPVAPTDGAMTPAVLAAAVLVVGTPVAVWRVGALYRILRRRRSVQLALVLVAALLVAYPLRGELWWPSCAILMLLAVIVSFRGVLAYCLAVLAISFASHAVGGDLLEMSAVSIIGLCIGYPFWAAAVAVTADRLAAYLLRLNTATAPPRAPRQVPTWTARPPTHPPNFAQQADAGTNADPAAGAPSTRLIAGGEPTDPIDNGEDEPESATVDGGSTITRLTARQLQVVALLADGLRYREVAACLSISTRQVQRHVAQAATRLGVHGAYELAAVAVSDGMVPDPANPRDTASAASS